MKLSEISYEHKLSLTHANIRTVAKIASEKYKAKRKLPKPILPYDLINYKRHFFDRYSEVIEEVRQYISKHRNWKNHGFAHLEEIALKSCYLAEIECKKYKIEIVDAYRLIDNTFLGGLFHDIDCYLGFGEEHAISGAKTALEILKKFGNKNKEILNIVRYHDTPYWRSDNLFEYIPYKCVYDTDKFIYGEEREKDLWITKEKLGVAPEELIHDYKYILPIVDTWQTTFGKKYGKAYLKYGLYISKYVENYFSV